MATAGRKRLSRGWWWRSRPIGWSLVAGSVGFSAALGTVGGWNRWLFLGLGVACAAGAAIRVDSLTKRQERSIQTAKQAAKDATEELILTLGDLVEPIAELLGYLIATPKEADRAKMAERLTEKTVQAAAAVCGPNDYASSGVRAVYFQLDAGPPPQLTYVTHHGRGDRPRHQQLPRAALAIALGRKRAALVENVAEDAPNPSAFADATYKTFLSVSVYAGEKVYGLLTVDAPRPGMLEIRDVRTVKVLAQLLACGLSAAR